MRRLFVPGVALIFAATLLVAACSQPTVPPAPTAAPAQTTKAPEATKAPAPTTAPAPTVAPSPQPTAAPKVSYPAGRPITLIVPVPAGGSMDVGARVIGPIMEKDLAAPLQIVNRAGAGHQVGLTELVLAKPDGYTLAYTANPSTLGVYLDPARKAVFTRSSFQPIAQVLTEPVGLAVKADSPYKTAKDLLDYAKANPEKVKMGASGLLGPQDLGARLLEKAAGVKFAIVNFDGGAPVLTALLGGHVDAMINQQSTMLPQFKTGEIRVLGIADTVESQFYPGVKTLESQGYKVLMASNHGITGQAGMPREIVDILTASVKKTLDNSDVSKRMLEMGLTPRYLTPEQFAKEWQAMEADVEPLVKDVAR